ncbi:MAG: Rieske 2Fe-2S domain-containing protein [Proteobacteria bacterium]|jgi:nitrite reductase/ring-hydroxylating ferredoxin subunit|nr:Rieske 2Fe-2S domain-containing protein [Pseudomonadota bacterium]MDA1299418.1 Rieske 2Fe-2S domain-containing protein [Pseudomonadota bacterium]
MSYLLDTNTLRENELQSVVLQDGTRLLVGRAGEHFFAIENLCTHAYVSFGSPRVKGCKITCPWHGLTFDMLSGQCDDWPGLPKLRRFEVEAREGALFLGQQP